MLLARCHIPGCLDTAGRRGFLCAEHWALVPKGLKLRNRVAVRAYDAAGRERQLPPAHAWPWETGAACIEAVLVQLWHGAFPCPEPCSSPANCGCPICAQARAVAPQAYAARRYVETATRSGPGERGAEFRMPRT